MVKFPKDDRFAEYVFDRDQSQTQSEDVEIPFRREVATDFKTLEDREKFAKMYDEDRANEVALANQGMKDQTDKWNAMLDELRGVKRRKEVEDFVGSDDMLSIANLRKKYPNRTEDYSDEELKDKSPKYRGSKEKLKDFLDPKYIKDESGELAKPSMSDEEFMKQDAIKKMNQEAVDAANKRLQAANAPKSDDEVMGDIEAQEANLKKQLKDGTISQAQFDLKQADLMAKAQGLGLAGERKMASRGEDREVAGIASPDQEQKEIVDFTGMTEREKLEYLRAAAQGRDDEMTFLDDIMKAGAIANQALASQGGYRVAQAKLPSMKTDMASRYDKLIKEYDALRKPSSKGKDIYKVGDELVQVKDGQVKKLYEGKDSGKSIDTQLKQAKLDKLVTEKQMKKSKEQREIADQINTIDSTLGNFKSVLPDLEKGSLTGFFDGTVKAAFDKAKGNDKAYTRKVLEKLRIDDVMLRVAKTKGAVSDNEMALFEKPAPSPTDQEETWVKWISERKDVLEKARKNLIKDLDDDSRIKTKSVENNTGPQGEYTTREVNGVTKKYRWNPRKGKYQLAE